NPTKPLHYFVTWLNHVSSFLYRNYSIFPISTMLSVHKKALHYFDLIRRIVTAAEKKVIRATIRLPAMI
ncbi:MAG: hypothetical protein V2B19_29260, partial [Pseudomonadota bacterium]